MNLKLDTLESWLWESANILRGSIDSSDFKNYIFGLLFLKRTNDTFEEEVELLMEEDGSTCEEAEEDAYFNFPPEAKWDYLIKVTENIGIELDKAFAAIERKNTSLEGVLTTTKFGDKDKLSDDVIKRLLERVFSNDNILTDIQISHLNEQMKQLSHGALTKQNEFHQSMYIFNTDICTHTFNNNGKAYLKIFITLHGIGNHTNVLNPSFQYLKNTELFSFN